MGQATISPDGENFVLYNWAGILPANTYTEIDLYRFDRCTGMLSDHIQVTDTPGLPGGVAFSPNSRYLYTSHWDKIYQWDLDAPDIVASRALVAEYDGFLGDYGLPTRFYNMKLGPDGKIYINVPNFPSRYLHVIDQPDSAGVACNVLQHSVLLPTFNNYSLPHHPVTRLGVMEGSPCDTIVSAVEAPPILEQEGWSLYPNPAAGSVTLSCAAPQSGPALWLLYDALGRELRREALPARYAEKTVSLEGLAKGLYFYRVEREGEAVHAGKLIVE
ncbi:MAG: T9SS type A sorting domain-containing protein [Saprospirales bacterium]|nr:T9SS type A sorting domain-containing protein [Saprospirales bacterium]